MGVEIRLANPSDAGAIGELFARAFASDPVTSWVTPTAARRQLLLTRLNTAIARYEGIPRGATYVASDAHTLLGAAIWQPPGKRPVSWRAIPFALIAGRALGRDTARMIAMGRAVSAARPRAKSWYLQLLGVEPSAQGSGVGSALVGEHLRVIDDERSASDLETTAENLAFYERLGFEISGEISIGRGAPIEYSLRRTAR
jgi:ribosomal protein S18 acetylase RimI-like enzyme